MNESLINPFFSISHPTTIQTSLFAGASLAKFDPFGRFVAAARPTGAVEIWDLETRAPIRSFEGHVRGITSIDWSRNSRYILSSSKDWNVVVWDLSTTSDPPQRYASIRFDNPVVSACFHPKNSRILAVVLSTGEAYVCDLRKNHRSRVELIETLLDEHAGNANGEGPTEDGGEDEETQVIRSPMKIARFDPSGRNIFAGTASGNILVFNVRTKIMVARHRIAGAGSIKGLDFAKSGRRLVTNSTDRTLRQFTLPTYKSPSAQYSPPSVPSSPSVLIQPSVPPFPFLDTDLEPTHRLSDPINKYSWNAVTLSPSGEYLAGGAADQANLKVYVWDLESDGRLGGVLEGGREVGVDVNWHPTKSTLLAVTKSGNILIWHSPHPERWGAFAGGFEEVDENVEYEEREDEFDIEDEAVLHARKMKTEEEEVDIDTFVSTGASRGGADVLSSGANPANKNSRSVTGTGSATPIGIPNSQPTEADTMDVDIEVQVATAIDTKLGGRQAGIEIPGPAGYNEGEAIADVDLAWALEEPDDDIQGSWRMKVVMESEDVGAYY
ncbi:WD40-repeat-containing domain protein [Crepidotus variabilis]|uniref:WD40-repeat-containing domain protein n=1 Tax=Crepidotus variabilis TaxID=179855 RepID=A0A9P6E364_9AGAR|nr:WD40-repeat-containing domain protein [Crepidotus variabilis]